MTSHIGRFLAVLTLTLPLAGSVVAQNASFQGLGDLPGGSVSSVANAVSSDGNAVAGVSVSGAGTEAFLWTAAGGLQGLGDLPGEPFQSAATGVSNGGTVVTGTGVLDASTRAFRWTQAGGMVPAPQLPGQPVIRSVGNGMSSDGATIVGDAGVNPEAFTWTIAGGMVGLGFMPGGGSSRASAISADGQVVVGTGSSSTGTQAFRWTAAGGMVALGRLPGATTSEAHAVSADGEVVVGGSAGQAFRWTQAGGMQQIAPAAVATAVSGDGSVVVGQAASVAGAFVWTQAEGIRSLRDVLVAQGVDMTGWDVRWATGVSPDGRVIVGWAFNAQGQQEAFRATLSGGHRWIDPTGGSWDVASNWEPASVPGPSDPVKFDLDGTYTITGGTAFGGATATALSADDGTVDFELGGLALTSLSGEIPSLTVSFDATAKIIAGTSTFHHGTVGFGANAPDDTTTAARLQVFNAGTSLTGSGVLVVGGNGGGRGEVFVAAGALRSFSAFVGHGAIGEAVVGNDGEWTLDNALNVGSGRRGRVLIEEGGRASARLVTIGSFLATESSLLDVSGHVDANTVSQLFVADTLRLGRNGPAALRIRDGGQVQAGHALVGVTEGDALVRLTNADNTPFAVFSELITTSLTIGVAPTLGASVEVHPVSQLSTRRLVVGGAGSYGVLAIEGGIAFSEREGFTGDCLVGTEASQLLGGVVWVNAGGSLWCDLATIGGGAGSFGSVSVSGQSETGRSSFTVSRVLRIASEGTLNLGGGLVDAVNASANPPADPYDVVLSGGGVIAGTGTIHGSVDDGGTVIPGGVVVVPSPRQARPVVPGGPVGGALQVNGRVVLEPSGTLELPLAGADSTLQGRLRVIPDHGMDGSVTLAGTLRLAFQDGYAPLMGDTFLLLDAASTTGAFDITEVTGLEPGWLFEIEIANGTVVLHSNSNGVPTTPAEPGAPAAPRVVLHPPAPNPTSGSMTLRFEVPEASQVRLTIFDPLGRLVATLANGHRVAGAHEVVLDVGSLAPGIYVMRLEAGAGGAARSISVIR